MQNLFYCFVVVVGCCDSNKVNVFIVSDLKIVLIGGRQWPRCLQMIMGLITSTKTTTVQQKGYKTTMKTMNWRVW